jgi:Uma2 family endonuclease
MAVSTKGLTVADLLERFGPMPAERIRTSPPPGTATEQDVIDMEERESRLCELVDGVLVEKALGVYESFLAMEIGGLLREFVKRNGLGFVVGADGMMRLAPGLVRIPDVSFVSWNQLPGRRVPRVPIADLAPELAIEVISASNTAQEMERKLQEYLTAGVRLVWYVLPLPQEVHVYTAGQHDVLTIDQELSGGDVLPGFVLPLRQLFEEPEEG